MAAAFLLEQGRRKMAEFPKEIEEEGIKFSVENATEDIINGLFCTYEPPTSKMQQYKAAKAVRKDPNKYAYRPSVPKSILKWKFKKAKKSRPQTPKSVDPPPTTTTTTTTTTTSEGRDDIEGAADAAADNGDKGVVVYEKKSVTWRDQASQKDRTDIENKVVGLAAKYCGGSCNQGEDIADILSSPTGRATQNFFAAGSEQLGSMANMASNLFGTNKTDVATTTDSSVVSNSNNNNSNNNNNKVFYDDLGNPIREDDMSQSVSSSSYLTTTPPAALSLPPTPASPVFAGNINDPKRGGHANLFCSNIPFMDTVVEGIGIAGVAAATAAVKVGVPENLCSPFTMKKTRPTTGRQMVTYSDPNEEEKAQISEELRQAQESLGIYEPESYDQPSESSGAIKLKRQATPKHVRRGTRKFDVAEDDITESSQQQQQRSTRSEDPNNKMSSQRSYANSDITMGNTTIKHFSGTASLFDETEDNEAVTPKNKKGGFTNMVEELKHVQKQKGLVEGASKLKDTSTGSVSSEKFSVKSLKQGYESIAKSPKKHIVTNSYINSLKSPSKAPGIVGEDAPRSGTVASLAKQFESPRNGSVGSRRTNTSNFVRQSIDPAESRNHDGTVHLLPPTPRRKKGYTEPPSNDTTDRSFGGALPPTPRRKSATPTGYSMVGKGGKLRLHDWDRMETKTFVSSSNTVQTDAEIRETASSILDVGPRKKNQLSFAGRRPRSLVTGPETVEDENEDPPEERQDEEKDNKSKKNKKKKKKEKRGKSKEPFASKFKKSMAKAIEPVRKATRNVESQRIAKSD